MNVDSKLYKVRIGECACGAGCCFDYTYSESMTYEEALNLASSLRDEDSENERSVQIIFLPLDQDVRWAVPFASRARTL